MFESLGITTLIGKILWIIVMVIGWIAGLALIAFAVIVFIGIVYALNPDHR